MEKNESKYFIKYSDKYGNYICRIADISNIQAPMEQENNTLIIIDFTAAAPKKLFYNTPDERNKEFSFISNQIVP